MESTINVEHLPGRIRNVILSKNRNHLPYILWLSHPRYRNQPIRYQLLILPLHSGSHVCLNHARTNLVHENLLTRKPIRIFLRHHAERGLRNRVCSPVRRRSIRRNRRDIHNLTALHLSFTDKTAHLLRHALSQKERAIHVSSHNKIEILFTNIKNVNPSLFWRNTRIIHKKINFTITRKRIVHQPSPIFCALYLCLANFCISPSALNKLLSLMRSFFITRVIYNQRIPKLRKL